MSGRPPDAKLLWPQIRYQNAIFWRTPVSAFFTLAFPLMFLIVFTLVFGNETIESVGVTTAQFFAPSLAVFGAVSATYTNLSITIAVGSGIQIALFVAPVLLFLSYVIGPQPMDLDFTLFEVIAVWASVVILAMVATDGESHWMEGVLLLAVYLVLGIAFYFLPG